MRPGLDCDIRLAGERLTCEGACLLRSVSPLPPLKLAPGMVQYAVLTALLGCMAVYAAPTTVTSFSNAAIAKVKSNLLQIATHR